MVSDCECQKLAEKLDKTKYELIEAIAQVRIDIASLKVKSGVWGFAAGAVPPMLFFLFKWFEK